MSASTPQIISGEVRAGGRAVADARVYIVDGPGSFSDIAALTDPHGRFSLTAPQEGSYKVTCAAEGFAPASITVALPAKGALVIDLDR
jgi:hypothetical protein